MKVIGILYTCLIFQLITTPIFVTAQNNKVDSLETELKKATDINQKIILFNDIFNEHFFTNYQKALDYSLNAYNLSLKEDAKVEFLSESANNVGVSYLLLDKYQLSLKYLLIALKEAEKNKDTLMISNSLYNLGVLFDTKDEVEKGLEYTIKAAELDEKMGDLENAAISYSGISATYFSIPDYKKGMNYYGKSITIADSIGDLETISVLYSSRALGLKS